MKSKHQQDEDKASDKRQLWAVGLIYLVRQLLKSCEKTAESSKRATKQ